MYRHIRLGCSLRLQVTSASLSLDYRSFGFMQRKEKTCFKYHIQRCKDSQKSISVPRENNLLTVGISYLKLKDQKTNNYFMRVRSNDIQSNSLSVFLFLSSGIASKVHSHRFYSTGADKTEMKGQIVVYSILGCPHCLKAKATLRKLDLPYTEVRLDVFPHIKDQLSKKSGMRTVPQIYFNDDLVGGNDALQKLVADKSKFEEYVDKVKQNAMPDDGPIVPDPETASSEMDPFIFECEPDEYFLLVEQMAKDDVMKKIDGGLFRPKKTFFIGKDLVKWLKDKKDVDEDRAVEMGQALLDRNFARSNTKHVNFVNDSTQYILLEDEEADALNSGPFSECTPKTANEIGEHLRKMILKLYELYLSPDGKKVDYKSMKSSPEFQSYKRMTRELLRVDPSTATREEKLAFFINIYNALVIHANIERGPPTNLWGRYKFFNNTKYIIGTNPYSLQDIENGVLRANRKGVGQFSLPFGKDDPRLNVALEKHEPLIHFGLVCGAKSCPPIKTYSAENIYEELQMAAKAFLDDDESCLVDLKNKTIKLSSIFKWYQEDFGQDKKELVEFVANHMGEGPKLDSLKELITKGNFKVSFLTYDWSVNSK